MALQLAPDLELVDPYDGLADLAAAPAAHPARPRGLVRRRSPAHVAGGPLHGQARTSSPTRALGAAVKSMHDRLSIVSAERIRDELDKLLVVPDPSPGLWFVVETGLAGEFLPELPALALEQDPIHRHKDVLAHTLAVVDKTRPDRLLRLAALLHDIGKPRTRDFGPGGVTFHHHEVVGARMARDRMTALRYLARGHRHA